MFRDKVRERQMYRQISRQTDLVIVKQKQSYIQTHNHTDKFHSVQLFSAKPKFI